MGRNRYLDKLIKKNNGMISQHFFYEGFYEVKSKGKSVKGWILAYKCDRIGRRHICQRGAVRSVEENGVKSINAMS